MILLRGRAQLDLLRQEVKFRRTRRTHPRMKNLRTLPLLTKLPPMNNRPLGKKRPLRVTIPRMRVPPVRKVPQVIPVIMRRPLIMKVPLMKVEPVSRNRGESSSFFSRSFGFRKKRVFE